MQRDETRIQVESVKFRLILGNELLNEFSKNRSYSYHEVFEQTTVLPEFISKVDKPKKYKVIFMEKDPPNSESLQSEFSWGDQNIKIYLVCSSLNDKNSFDVLNFALNKEFEFDKPHTNQIIFIGVKDHNKKMLLTDDQFIFSCTQSNLLDFMLVDINKPKEFDAIIQLALLHYEYNQLGYRQQAIPTPMKAFLNEKNPFKHQKEELTKYFLKSKNEYLCHKEFRSLDTLSLERINNAFATGRSQYCLNFSNRFYTLASSFSQMQTPDRVCEERKNKLFINASSYPALYFFLIGEGSLKLNSLKYLVIKNLFPEMYADTEGAFKNQVGLLVNYLSERDDIRALIKSVTFLLCMHNFKYTLPKELNLLILKLFLTESSPQFFDAYTPSLCLR